MPAEKMKKNGANRTRMLNSVDIARWKLCQVSTSVFERSGQRRELVSQGFMLCLLAVAVGTFHRYLHNSKQKALSLHLVKLKHRRFLLVTDTEINHPTWIRTEEKRASCELHLIYYLPRIVTRTPYTTSRYTGHCTISNFGNMCVTQRETRVVCILMVHVDPHTLTTGGGKSRETIHISPALQRAIAGWAG